jgi:hypothetical protein
MLHRTCDGISRRDALRIGTLTFGGLSLGGYRRMAAAGEVAAGRADRAIFIDLSGGPSHIDSFDPKPDAPVEIRGAFQTIGTTIPGIRFSEHLPKLAVNTDKFALLRGVSHTLAAHRLGQEYVSTGTKPIAAMEYPGYGSVLSKQLGGQNDIPNHVAVPKSAQGPGFLGIRHAALETNSTPKPDLPYSVRGLAMPKGVNIDTINLRQSLLKKLDRRLDSIASSDLLLQGMDRFGDQAYQMITSPRARKAFDKNQIRLENHSARLRSAKVVYSLYV